jgi:hypothetical protein
MKRHFAEKQWAFLLLIVLASAFFFSALYVTRNADHDCAGEECGTCLQIDAVLNVFTRWSCAFVVVACLILAFFLFRAIFDRSQKNAPTPTLVSLRVKLNN